jgi:hypothetical protein
MKRYLIIAAGALITCITAGFALQGSPSKVSVTMTSKSVSQGQKALSNSEVFFDVINSTMIMHSSYPEEWYMITNKFGEAKMYHPKENTVRLTNNPSFSTQESILYLFLSSTSPDLGFKKMGFTLRGSKFEEDLIISTWIPPKHMESQLSKAEIVLKNYQPTYLAYFSPAGDVIKKVYYTNYLKDKAYTLPLRVTTIDYIDDLKDSIVTRIDYSDLKTNSSANNVLGTFKIPDNAKPVE